MKNNDMKATWNRKLKAIVCLFGQGKIGKSTTLSAVASAFQDEARFYYEQKCQHDSRDRRIVLKINGMIIGIGTAGDDPETIDRNFRFFQDMKCDYALTAARVDGACNMNFHIQTKLKSAKLKSVKFIELEKRDAHCPYAQDLVVAALADHIIAAFKQNKTKAIIQHLKKG